VRIAFILLSTDEAHRLEHALPAALAEAPDEAVVVDNASGDATARVAADHGVPCLRLEQRASYCRAMNRALQAVEADAVALLQADTFVTPGYKEAVLARLRDPDVGSVAPKLVRAAGPAPGERLDEIDAAGMTLDRRRKNGLAGHGAPAAAYATPGEAFGADGAAAVYRRETLADCALDGAVFDELLADRTPEGEHCWAADADLAWRARVLGWRTAYEPAAVVYHVRTYSPSTRGAVSAVSRRMQFRNRYLMMAKNDSARDLARDLPLLLGYEVLALGHALLRERELLGGYRDAWRRLPAARRRRREIQARRRVRRVPFGLAPPP
jgi:GT2 family glycosyltransferase